MAEETLIGGARARVLLRIQPHVEKLVLRDVTRSLVSFVISQTSQSTHTNLGESPDMAS